MASVSEGLAICLDVVICRGLEFINCDLLFSLRPEELDAVYLLRGIGELETKVFDFNEVDPLGGRWGNILGVNLCRACVEGGNFLIVSLNWLTDMPF